VSTDPVSLEDIRSEALAALHSVPAGQGLDERTRALLRLAVHAAALDADGTRTMAESALEAGADPEQLIETLVLVAGIGMHSLLEGCLGLGEVLRDRADPVMTAELDEGRARLWSQYVETDPYWSRDTPDFVETLLRLSPDGYQAFFAFVGVPWRTRALRTVTKELIALAVDATPSHRYLPGLSLHLDTLIRFGVGREAILEALEIAADAPPHRGVR
jgi:alkylhydroperoxidase/carboxymuconolactone decarboxylase family protein YurZ